MAPSQSTAEHSTAEQGTADGSPQPAAAPVGRQRIMDSAATLFLDRGYAQTSLRDIAAAAGMKAGSVYYHFDSKEDLLAAILVRGIEVMVDAFEVVERASRDDSAQLRLSGHIRSHLAALFEHGPYTAAHVTTFHTAPPDVRSRIVPLRDAYERLWAEFLAELGDRDELAADVDLTLARLLLFGSMNATIEWFDPERGSVDQLAGSIARTFWAGVGRSGAR